VLDRYYQAAIKFRVKTIIRISADCPLIDPNISREVLKKFQKGNYDYVATDDKTIPKALILNVLVSIL
jgi:spore coat polysaccharide biosynthesis protein SpsF (cytidylyltransferase family)